MADLMEGTATPSASAATPSASAATPSASAATPSASAATPSASEVVAGQGAVECVKRLPRSQKKRDKIVLARKRRKETRSDKRRSKRWRMAAERHNLLGTMTTEERRAFIVKERLEAACETDKTEIRLQALFDNWPSSDSHSSRPDTQRVCINCSFDDTMSEAEASSLAKQLLYCYLSLRRDQNCMIQLHFSSFDLGSRLHQQCNFHGFEKWKVRLHEAPFWEVFSDKKIVVLSPDAEEELSDITTSEVYVIGGLVDKSISKNQTLAQASQHGLTTKRLPLRTYVPEYRHPVLNVNSVFGIVKDYAQCKDWEKALRDNLPTRKIGRSETARRQRRKEGEGEESAERKARRAKDSAWCSGKARQMTAENDDEGANDFYNLLLLDEETAAGK